MAYHRAEIDQAFKIFTNTKIMQSFNRLVSGRYLLMSLLIFAVTCLFKPDMARAADGTWTQATSGGLWSNPANWSGGTIADGAGATANLGTLNLAANNTVVLDASHTLSAIKFSDTTSTFFNWTLSNNGNPANVLTLAGALSPSITITAG